MSIFTEIARLDAPASGAFDFSAPTLTGFVAIEIVIGGVTVTTDNTVVSLQFYVGGVLITTGHRFAMVGSRNDALLNTGTTTGSGIVLGSDASSNGVGNVSGETFNSIIHIDDPLNTARYKRISWESWWASANTSAQRCAGVGGGMMENAGAITGFKIVGGSNLLAGKVRLLGMT